MARRLKSDTRFAKNTFQLKIKIRIERTNKKKYSQIEAEVNIAEKKG